jgi:tetratricopeptide (TPR) repeat protein
MLRHPMCVGLALLVALPVSASLFGQNTSSSVNDIEALIRAHDYDRARGMVQTALRNSPRNPDLWTLEGIIDSITGKTADASKDFETALKIDPDDPAALRGEVQILYKSQDKRAIPLLERILVKAPNDSTAHEMLATLEERQGDCKAAVEQFALAGAATASHPLSLEGDGKCLMQLRRPAEAAPIFQQLVDALPQQTWPRYDLAVALADGGQNQSAIEVLAPLIAADHPDPDALRLASDAYEATGDTPKAVALLRQAIVLNPDEPGYYVAFTALCLNHESFKVGVDMLDIGIRHIPRSSSLFIARGLLYAQMAQYDNAEADFRTAEKLDAAQGVSAYAIDLTDLQKNKPAEAIEHVRTQLRTHPRSALLHYLLAKLLWAQGNQAGSPAMAEAQKEASAAIALKPDLNEARDLLADIDIASSRYSDAEQQSRTALETDPSDQTAIYHLIVALRHNHQENAATEIPALVKRLSALQQQSLDQETARKHFSLVESKTEQSP